jgi:hypothetical protein
VRPSEFSDQSVDQPGISPADHPLMEFAARLKSTTDAYHLIGW